MITLYTLCPECKKEYAISVKQLRISRAIVKCNRCAIKFDALELLNDAPVQRENKPALVISDSELPYLPWEKQRSMSKTIRWDWACYVTALLLIGQIYSWQNHNLTQNTSVRPWLETACSLVGCTLTPYDNRAEMTIIHGILQAGEEQELIFQVSFSNEAKFSQTYPGLKLILFNYDGDILGQRIFSVKEYLPEQHQTMIKAGEQVDIKLMITEPLLTIGGYKFELT